ncbi:heavy-metal-associated domain-containing protein [Ligilactobacillus faecis]|uniref:Heavy-metal-associated domain-containing protein n=1 Tax=Ligilactobacillus faecis TaxID=762833 RepID=A0ABV4DR42_9LACO
MKEKHTVHVLGMKGACCAAKVKESLSKLVEDVKVDLKKGTAEYIGDETIDHLNDTLEGTPYSVTAETSAKLK